MRRDAKRIKNISGMEQLMYDIKPLRNASDVFINQDFDVTNLVKYIEKKKKEGYNYTYFHAFMMAFAKVMYNRPKLNRFISNRHLYEHNEITLSFVAKVAFEDKAEEMMIIIPIEENDTIDEVCNKIRDKVDGIRNRKDKKKGANNALDVLGKLPNIIRVPFMALVKKLDTFGMLPKAFTEDNVYYSSALLTNIGVLGCGAIYHNNTNFGTCSSTTAIGEIKDKEIIIDGKKKIRKICDFGINFDERVADGFYMIKSMKLLEHILNNPELLENPANEKIEINSMRSK